MRARITQMLVRLDARTVRERLLIGAVALVVLFVAMDLLLLTPTGNALKADRDAVQRLGQQTRTLEAQVAQLQAALAVDPDAENRRTLAQLQQQVQGLDAELEQRLVQLIGPEEMARVLQDLLRREVRLTLHRIESEPPVAATDVIATEEQPEADAPTQVPTLYRHAVQVEFEGDYLSALAYLKAVEGLPWRFYWDRVEILSQDYPKARIRLRLFTLSVSEGWIGV